MSVAIARLNRHGFFLPGHVAERERERERGAKQSPWDFLLTSIFFFHPFSFSCIASYISSRTSSVAALTLSRDRLTSNWNGRERKDDGYRSLATEVSLSREVLFVKPDKSESGCKSYIIVMV